MLLGLLDNKRSNGYPAGPGAYPLYDDYSIITMYEIFSRLIQQSSFCMRFRFFVNHADIMLWIDKTSQAQMVTIIYFHEQDNQCPEDCPGKTSTTEW